MTFLFHVGAEAYLPPEGDEVDFMFEEGYVPPEGDDVDFDFGG
jgi:hypothetical protein